MDKSELNPQRTRQSVIAVPPLARTADGTLAIEENRKLAAAPLPALTEDRKQAAVASPALKDGRDLDRPPEDPVRPAARRPDRRPADPLPDKRPVAPVPHAARLDRPNAPAWIPKPSSNAWTATTTGS